MSNALAIQKSEGENVNESNLEPSSETAPAVDKEDGKPLSVQPSGRLEAKPGLGPQPSRDEVSRMVSWLRLNMNVRAVQFSRLSTTAIPPEERYYRNAAASCVLGNTANEFDMWARSIPADYDESREREAYAAAIGEAESRPGFPPNVGPCAEGLTDQGQGGTACECPRTKALERLIPFVEAFRLRPQSNEPEYNFLGQLLDFARAALLAPCPCEGMRRENEQLRAAILPDHKQYSLSFVLSVADGLRADHEAYLDALRACYGEDMGDGCEDTLAGGIERLHRLAGQGIAVRTVFGKDVCDLDGDETGEYLQRARKRAEDAEAERDSLRDELRHKSARLETVSEYASRIAAELANLQGERAVLLVEMEPGDGTLIGVAAEMGRLRALLAKAREKVDALEEAGHLTDEQCIAAEAERNSLRDKLAAAVSSHTNLSNFAEPMSDVDRLCIEIESERAQKESAQQELAASQERERALREALEKLQALALDVALFGWGTSVTERYHNRRIAAIERLRAAAFALATPEGAK